MSILSSLRRFREWFRTKGTICTNLDKAILRGKLKKVEITEGFPYLNVVEAYLYPKVDSNSEKFSWGQPNDEAIRDFTRKKFGWTRLKTDETLLPVLDRLNTRKLQKSITNYFNLQSTPTDKNLKVSKRMRTALNKLSGNTEDDTELLEVSPKKPKHGKAKQKRKAIKKTESNDDIIIISSQNDNEDISTSSTTNHQSAKESEITNDIILISSQNDEVLPSCSTSNSQVTTKKTRGRPAKKENALTLGKPRAAKVKSSTKGNEPSTSVKVDDEDDAFATKKVNRKRKINNNTIEKRDRVPRIPNTKLPIPQREKDLEEIEMNRMKAAEIFKKSKN